MKHAADKVRPAIRVDIFIGNKKTNYMPFGIWKPNGSSMLIYYFVYFNNNWLKKIDKVSNKY